MLASTTAPAQYGYPLLAAGAFAAVAPSPVLHRRQLPVISPRSPARAPPAASGGPSSSPTPRHRTLMPVLSAPAAVPEPLPAGDLVVKSAFADEQQHGSPAGREPEALHDELVLNSELPEHDDDTECVADEAPPPAVLSYDGKRYMLFRVGQEGSFDAVGSGEVVERADAVLPYGSSPAVLLSGRDELYDLPLSHFVTALKASLEIGEHRDTFVEFPQLELCFVEGREDSKGITLDYLRMMLKTLHRYRMGYSAQVQLHINIWDFPKHSERVNFLEMLMLTEKVSEYVMTSDNDDDGEKKGFASGECRGQSYLEGDYSSDEEGGEVIEEQEVEKIAGNEEHDEGNGVEGTDVRVKEIAHAEDGELVSRPDERKQEGSEVGRPKFGSLASDNQEEHAASRFVADEEDSDNEDERQRTPRSSVADDNDYSADDANPSVTSPAKLVTDLVSQTALDATSQREALDKPLLHEHSYLLAQNTRDSAHTVSLTGECFLAAYEDVQSESDQSDNDQSAHLSAVPQPTDALCVEGHQPSSEGFGPKSCAGRKRSDTEGDLGDAGNEEINRKRLRL